MKHFCACVFTYLHTLTKKLKLYYIFYVIYFIYSLHINVIQYGMRVLITKKLLQSSDMYYQPIFNCDTQTKTYRFTLNLMHSAKQIPDYFQIEENVIAVTVFQQIMNQTEICLVHNQKEYCHYDCIPFDLKIM